MQAFEARTKKWREEGNVRTHKLDDPNPARVPPAAQIQTAPKAPAEKRSKYGNKRTVVGGEKYDSAKEARRGQDLILLQQAGEICELSRQVRFDLKVKGHLICAYVADFTYRDKTKPGLTVEDVKGVRTREYIIKKRLMKAIHGIEVKET